MVTEITMLTAPSCTDCEASKEAILSVMGEYEIEFEEIDATEQPEYAAEYRILAAPGILIDGTLEFHGRVSERELRQTLDGIPR